MFGGCFKVAVASGEKLVSRGQCKVTLNVQGVPIYVEFYLLPLEGMMWYWELNGYVHLDLYCGISQSYT